jgi:glycosyltransferase involved in cell wall biosynthesis
MDIQVIHVVLGKANPERMNGVNKVVNSLATYQKKLGYEVSLWGITKTLVLNFPKRNYSTELFQDTGKFTLDSDIDVCLQELPSSTVFHIHGGFIPQFYLLARKLNRLGFEYIYTPHGAYNSVALQRNAWKKKIYILLFEKYLVRNAKRLHFIGASEVDGAEKVFGKVPFELIPNGQKIEELDFMHQSLKTGRIPVFGFVGRIDIKTKGLDILLQGFAEYVEKHGGNGQLWLIGDGDELPKLMEMAQSLNISSKLKFLGSKYGDEKLNIMANMDYLCLTSRNEGLPGVVLEASALKVPCIVSSETNMGDYITQDHAGLCLSENSPSKLALAFQTAGIWHHNGELKRVGNNAQKMVKKHFDWSAISQKLMNAYAA